MSGQDHLNGAQFSTFEQRLLNQRSVWEDGNDDHIARIVDRHATDAPTLYRGVAVSSARNYLDPEKVQVGHRMSLPVSSFSSDPDVAHEFAHGDPDEHNGRYTPTMLRVEGARGLSTEHVSNMPWEHEWLSHGQFEVTHKGSDPDNDIAHVIGLRSVGR